MPNHLLPRLSKGSSLMRRKGELKPNCPRGHDFRVPRFFPNRAAFSGDAWYRAFRV
jgi:hypothetical protein